MAYRQTFTSAPSVAMLTKIIQFVCDGCGVTSKDIQKRTGLSNGRVSQYLRHAEATLRKVHKLPRGPRKGTLGGVCDIWVRGPAPKPGEPEPFDDEEKDYAPRKVIVRTYYPPNRARDPYHLPAEFFASAQQRNEQ